jgi:hypothetical protein
MRVHGLPLPIHRYFAQKRDMEQHDEPAGGWRALLRWAMTPPQSVAVYFIVLVLVLGASFYAGTLKPKKVTGAAPSVTIPNN